jgi:hypothetical protein
MQMPNPAETVWLAAALVSIPSFFYHTEVKYSEHNVQHKWPSPIRSDWSLWLRVCLVEECRKIKWLHSYFLDVFVYNRRWAEWTIWKFTINSWNASAPQKWPDEVLSRTWALFSLIHSTLIWLSNQINKSNKQWSGSTLFYSSTKQK